MIDYLLTSSVILLIGLAFNLYLPSRLNGKYGYRSKAALKSQESWELAHKLSKTYLVIAGIISLLVALILYEFGHSNMARLLSVILPVGILIISIFLIERRLRY